jgi:hypothetical protein
MKVSERGGLEGEDEIGKRKRQRAEVEPGKE